MKITKLHKGQKVVCVHYKDHPIVKVDSIWKNEVWVREFKPKRGSGIWWGPRNWFKALPKRKVLTKRTSSGKLCDDGVLGCTCNQSASVAQ